MLKIYTIVKLYNGVYEGTEMFLIKDAAFDTFVKCTGVTPAEYKVPDDGAEYHYGVSVLDLSVLQD